MSGRDWKSDPTTGELVLEDGDLVFVEDAIGDPASIRQDLEERLRLVRAEWFLSDPDSTHPDDGVDLFGSVLGKGRRPSAIAAVYRAAILATPGVASIGSLLVTVNRPARTATVTFEARTDFGTISGTVPTTIGG